MVPLAIAKLLFKRPATPIRSGLLIRRARILKAATELQGVADDPAIESPPIAPVRVARPCGARAPRWIASSIVGLAFRQGIHDRA